MFSVGKQLFSKSRALQQENTLPFLRGGAELGHSAGPNPFFSLFFMYHRFPPDQRKKLILRCPSVTFQDLVTSMQPKRYQDLSL